MADSAAQTTNPTVDDAAICGLKVIFSLILLVFLSLLSFWNFKSWNLTPYAYFWISELQVSDILLPHPSNPKSFCLGPRIHENPIDLISCEANRITFMSQNIDLNLWADCLRAWPNPPESWITWYSRVAKTYMPLWQELNIADALTKIRTFWKPSAIFGLMPWTVSSLATVPWSLLC